MSTVGAYKMDWISLSTQNVEASPIMGKLAIIQSSSMARWRVVCQGSMEIISIILGVSNWEEHLIQSLMDRDLGILCSVAVDLTMVIGIGVIGWMDTGTTKL